MARTLPAVVALLAVTSSLASNEQSRWSRQISSYTSDISDWVPLPGPAVKEQQVKRQAVAEPRILSEPFPGFARPTGFQDFPSRGFFQQPSNRQLYLQSVPAVPSAPQNYLSDQGFGQNIRFGLSQPNFPLSQGFVSPQFPFESVQPVSSQINPQINPQIKQQINPQIRPQAPPSNPIKFETFNAPLASQSKPFPVQQKIKPESPKYVDGYKVESSSEQYSFTQKKRPQSLQKLKYETVDKAPKLETIVGPKQKNEREEVQLLYVPVESLNRGQFNFRNPIAPSKLNTDFYQTQKQPVANFQPEFQRPIANPIENFSFGTAYNQPNTPIKDYQVDQVPKFSTLSSPFPVTQTTPKPKKLKPHQPPLAIFLSRESRKENEVKVSDVLSSLKNANTVAVLDSVNPITAPKVFIGPSNLAPPTNFAKFELPYLSNIENGNKKIRQLPFFVAPLSYNTPDGFAKIPFPSPHVGSVVINSQINPQLQATPIADVIPNSYSASSPSYQQGQTITQKPTFSYYTTSPPRTPSTNQQSNYYSIEPQTVNTVRPPKEPESLVTSPPKTNSNSYFLSDVNNNQFNPSQYVNFPSQSNYETPEPSKHTVKESTTTPRTTPSSTKSASTYPSQLLETHNPYSINQAFHFSTPLDYHNYFDEFKDNYATPGFMPSQSSTPASPSTADSSSPKPEEVTTVTEKPKYQQQSSPNYIQYSPEIHYESEIPNSRYVYNTNSDYTTKTEPANDYQPGTVATDGNLQTHSNVNPEIDYNGNIETQSPSQENIDTNDVSTASYGIDAQSTRSPYSHNENSFDNESKETTSSSTTTTTRRPIRGRGRPRYTTTPRTYSSDSNESVTRSVVTRRPLREKRPLPTRARYEPNKISTEKPEKPSKRPTDSSESTTKSIRGRTRGRVQYKPTEYEDNHEKKKTGKEDQDLAYQRDVLHQNYPVTLMERASTVDIEAITEPTSKLSLLNSDTEVHDTDNAYTNEKVSFTPRTSESAEDIRVPSYTQRPEVQTEGRYVTHVSSNRNEDYIYQSRSSLAPVEALQYDESSPDQDDIPKQTTPLERDRSEVHPTEPTSPVTEEPLSKYSIENDFAPIKSDSVNTTPETEIVRSSKDLQTDQEENTVQTTPSYNRVRVRPGVVRQYHQASSTESSRTKTERRRPAQQAITYRPAFERRRTTMRIEEIEADLKTKQIHARPETQDRHPVYRPEPTTEAATSSPTTQETTTKRGAFRRRRPSYSTTSTSTESYSTKKIYEVKNRFRGRRPITSEKTTEKSEAQTEAPSTTKSTPYNRYSHRPRLSERYNKKPQQEEIEDQESNYSINRPEYVEPDTEQWSPKINGDSFRPYNPNDIIEDQKLTSTDFKSGDDEGLDIITARNEYEDVLISVTPASNNRANKKIPDIPPTLEAYVEQSKTTKADSGDNMSTFESMLEEVMKSLEEQDKDEYTSTVKKHKGGEIGEIPPERVISTDDSYTQKPTTLETTEEPASDGGAQVNEDDNQDRKSRRRGFWKKVKVRPVSESFDTAESQYYSHTVNRLGDSVKSSKNTDKDHDKPKNIVTTYKPAFQFIKDIFESDDENLDVLPTIDLTKINANHSDAKETVEDKTTTEFFLSKETPTEENLFNPGDMDLGTGSPDPTLTDIYATTTEPITESIDKSDTFNLMEYLFGAATEQPITEQTTKVEEVTTEDNRPKIVTTETSYVPEEITSAPEEVSASTESVDIKKINTTEGAVETTNKSVSVEISSESSYMSPDNVVSTSMSTEISHETEICFRGKCIKANKDML